MRTKIILTGVLAGAVLSFPAQAQRTNQNVVADADDAFGRSIGGEQIGIYSPFNVRNFSPVAAGNVRIEGFYFDQQAFATDRIINGRTVRVGISAQGYPFPAPTGIADYELRKPGAEAIAATAFTYGPYGGINAEMDIQLPIIGETLGLTAGAALHHSVFDSGSTPKTSSFGASLLYKPSPDFSIQPFYGHIRVRGEEQTPLIFTSGEFLPPPIDRPDFFGQKWADFTANVHTVGLVSRGRVAGFDLGLGMFRSTLDVQKSFNDLLTGTDRDGVVANRIIVADQGNKFSSTSGELRISRAFIEGPRRHGVHLSLRGRALDRRYGGSSIVSLGPSHIGVEDYRPEPTFSFGPKSRDEVRQKTFGIGYEGRWRGVGELSIGVQKTDYRKNVLTPDGALPETHDSPLLFSATAAAYLTSKLAVYGGYTRGLEESDVAPPNAVNRNEAPPALQTQQQDIGIRYALRPRLSLIAGLFRIEKPYFNLDGASRFRQLGEVRNSGVELSLAGQITPRLTAVAGATWIDSQVSGEQVAAGLIGERPIGAFKLRTLANVNWQVPWHEALTLTARFESTSARAANRLNTLEIPARSVTSLGARYQTSVGKTPVLIRGVVDNIFDEFGWNVGGSGAFTANGARRYSLTVAADL